MQFTIDLADELDPVAIYAALVATVVAVWEVVKWWRQGPRLRGTATPNMNLMGAGYKDDKTYIVFTVRNIGTEKTTITHVALYHYPNWWSWIRKRHSSKAWIINSALETYRIPYVLNVGEQFMATGVQTEEFERLSRDGRLCGVIVHSFSNKPLLMRIKAIPKSKETTKATPTD